MAPRHRQLLTPGQSAPSFTLPQLDGPDLTLSGLLESGSVLLAFFKISCPVCQMTLPFLDRLHQSGAARVHGVSQNDTEDTRQFIRHFSLTFPVLLDSEDAGFPASGSYGISSVPTLYEIAADGTITHVTEGWIKTEMQRLGALRQDDNVPAWKAG